MGSRDKKYLTVIIFTTPSRLLFRWFPCCTRQQELRRLQVSVYAVMLQVLVKQGRNRDLVFVQENSFMFS